MLTHTRTNTHALPHTHIQSHKHTHAVTQTHTLNKHTTSVVIHPQALQISEDGQTPEYWQQHGLNQVT